MVRSGLVRFGFGEGGEIAGKVRRLRKVREMRMKGVCMCMCKRGIHDHYAGAAVLFIYWGLGKECGERKVEGVSRDGTSLGKAV